jgi:hypothetical protein
MKGGDHRGYVFLYAMATLIVVASICIYRIRAVAGITFGSTAIALAVLAHVGILAGTGASVVALRRRPGQYRRK